MPRVLDHDDETLLMSKLPGTDATDRTHWFDLETTVTAMAHALRDIHAVPTTECPFDASPPALMRQAGDRVARGEVDPNDFEPGNRRYTAPELFDRLAGLPLPEPDDPVFCHGDYCLPNVLLQDGRVTGVVDWGRAGVGDRYLDLALAARSIVHNTGMPALAVRFFDAYGVDRIDGRKIDWFVLLDQFL